MPIRLRSVDDFAKEVGGKKKAKQILSDKGIRIIDGFFDERRLEAAFAEPAWLRNRRKAWSLSHTSGLGAVKYLMDPLKINIIEHECRGAQWLMLQGSSGKRNFVKMYYKGTLTHSMTVGRFEIRNFLRSNAPSHFLCVAFPLPHAWVLEAKELTKRWHALKKMGRFEQDEDGFHIPYGAEDHEGGFLGITLRTTQGEYTLDDASKLGI